MPLGVFLKRRLALHPIGLIVPLVKAFVPNHEPHPIAKIEQLGRRRVVACTNRINAHVAHDLQLSLHGPRIERRAERPLIVVQIHAMELDTATVEMKTIIGREFEFTDAKSRRFAIEVLGMIFLFPIKRRLRHHFGF